MTLDAEGGDPGARSASTASRCCRSRRAVAAARRGGVRARRAGRPAWARAAVVVGDNFRFGRGRAGDARAARRSWASAWASTVTTVAPVAHDGAADQQHPHPRGAGRGRRRRRARTCSAGASSWTASSRRARAAAARPGLPDREPGDRERDAARERGLRLPVRGAAASRRARGGREPGARGRRSGAGPSARSRPTCSTSTGDLYGRAVRTTFVARLRDERALRRTRTRSSRQIAAGRRARTRSPGRRDIVAGGGDA